MRRRQVKANDAADEEAEQDEGQQELTVPGRPGGLEAAGAPVQDRRGEHVVVDLVLAVAGAAQDACLLSAEVRP